jgi:hypothetical protein
MSSYWGTFCRAQKLYHSQDAIPAVLRWAGFCGLRENAAGRCDRLESKLAVPLALLVQIVGSENGTSFVKVGIPGMLQVVIRASRRALDSFVCDDT